MSNNDWRSMQGMFKDGPRCECGVCSACHLRLYEQHRGEGTDTLQFTMAELDALLEGLIEARVRLVFDPTDPTRTALAKIEAALHRDTVRREKEN